MKALSVRQPWAWLLVNGWKDVENRTWPTKFRGRVLIHAGKTCTPFDREGWEIFEANAPDGFIPPGFTTLDRGGIVGEVIISDCVTVSGSPWFMGPYGFVISNWRPLPFVPCNGALGFFDVKIPGYDGLEKINDE